MAETAPNTSNGKSNIQFFEFIRLISRKDF